MPYKKDNNKREVNLTAPAGTVIELKSLKSLIKVVKSGTGRVSIVIDAPKDIKIHRSKNAES